MKSRKYESRQQAVDHLAQKGTLAYFGREMIKGRDYYVYRYTLHNRQTYFLFIHDDGELLLHEPK
jgi:hypothetical protein